MANRLCAILWLPAPHSAPSCTFAHHVAHGTSSFLRDVQLGRTVARHLTDCDPRVVRLAWDNWVVGQGLYMYSHL